MDKVWFSIAPFLALALGFVLGVKFGLWSINQLCIRDGAFDYQGEYYECKEATEWPKKEAK